MVPASPLPALVTFQGSKGVGKPPIDSSKKFDTNNSILLRDKSNSHNHTFLLNFDFFNKNVHNFLIYSGASSNIMPYFVCLKLNIAPQKSVVHIMQLYRTNVKVLGEMNYVLIRLASNSKVHQVIEILVTDIADFYGLIMSRDWSENFHSYFSTYCLICGFPTMVRQIKFALTSKTHEILSSNFEDETEPMDFTNNILGNYSAELVLGNLNAQKSPFLINSVNFQIENFS